MEPVFPPETPMEERFGKCPYATAQSLISGKWSVLILHYLASGPLRFNQLQRLMPKMTHATLSAQLKALVDNGLVSRKDYGAAEQRVEYALTPIGREFQPVLDALEAWGRDYIAQMGVPPLKKHPVKHKQAAHLQPPGRLPDTCDSLMPGAFGTRGKSGAWSILPGSVDTGGKSGAWSI